MRQSILLVMVLVGGLQAGENWPAYRGPQGDGLANAKNLPEKWSETENVLWKTEIPHKGWSSPVRWNDQIWCTGATDDGKKLYAYCLNLADGKIVHEILVFEVKEPQKLSNPVNGYASPTPVIEEGFVYVHFGSPGTACLDSKTGKKIWERTDFVCNHFRGSGSSPILYDKMLLLTFDGFDKQYLAALDKTTGKTIWIRDRNFHAPEDNGDYKKAYSTPSVFKMDGKEIVVSSSAGASAAYDLATGQEVWRVKHGGMNVASRPITKGDKIYLTTGDGGKNAIYAVKKGGTGDVTSTHVAWTGKANPKYGSLTLIGDYIFLVSNDVATLLDAETGKELSKERLGGKFYGSPVVGDGKIFVFNEDGIGFVLKIEEGKITIVQQNKLASGCMASPIVVDDTLVVRTKTHLYRIGLKK